MIVLALIALASVLFNIIYAIKTIMGKDDAKNKGVIGSVLLLIMSVLFFVVYDENDIVSQAIKMGFLGEENRKQVRWARSVSEFEFEHLK